MVDRITIMTICAVGVGSSLMLKYNAREVLERHGIQARITNADMTAAKGQAADIVIITPDLSHAIAGSRSFKRVIVLENMVSKKELEEKLVPACLEVLGHAAPPGK